MNTRNVLTRCFVLGVAVLGLTSFAARAEAEDVLASLMQQTGMKYSPVPKEPDSWQVPFDLPDGGTIDEYVTYSNDKHEFAMIFISVIRREPHHVFSYALLKKAMELNNDRPGTKFVLDDDNGDIDCQAEIYLPTATPDALKTALNNVASTANVYGAELKGL